MSDLEYFRIILLVFSAPILIINFLTFMSGIGLPKEGRGFLFYWDTLLGTPLLCLALTYLF